MKIAVTYQDGDIFQHFGHTEFFKIYDIENTDIVKTEIVSTNGSGHGALAQFLHEHSVDTLICGGKVVLPEPDSPIIATNSPSSTENVTFESACTLFPPKRVLYIFLIFVTSSKAINGAPFF